MRGSLRDSSYNASVSEHLRRSLALITQDLFSQLSDFPARDLSSFSCKFLLLTSFSIIIYILDSHLSEIFYHVVREGEVNHFFSLICMNCHWRDIAYSPPVHKEISITEHPLIPLHLQPWFSSRRNFETNPTPYLHFQVSGRILCGRSCSKQEPQCYLCSWDGSFL